ncbi:MAG: hypothetical protein ACLTSX_04790 [Collinsella sp.]
MLPRLRRGPARLPAAIDLYEGSATTPGAGSSSPNTPHRARSIPPWPRRACLDIPHARPAHPAGRSR